MKIWSRTYLHWYKEDTGSCIVRCVRLVRNKRPVPRVISTEAPHPGLDKARAHYRKHGGYISPDVPVTKLPKAPEGPAPGGRR